MEAGARERTEVDIAGMSAERRDRMQGRPSPSGTGGGEGPIGAAPASCYLGGMNPLLLIVILILLFGGGGFYVGGPAYGGGGIGLIVLICIIIYLFGGFRGPKN